MNQIATESLLDQLRDDRSLDSEERFHLLIDVAVADRVDLLGDIVAEGFNALEKRIVLALALLDWPKDEPRVTDLALVLKERAGPRANPTPKIKELDVSTQLGYLKKKRWVESHERDDGTLYWRLKP